MGGPLEEENYLPETNSSELKTPIFPGKYQQNGLIFQPAMLVYWKVLLMILRFSPTINGY